MREVRAPRRRAKSALQRRIVNVFGESRLRQTFGDGAEGRSRAENARASAFRAVAFPHRTRRNFAKLLLTR
jgi:hypothetical protein